MSVNSSSNFSLYPPPDGCLTPTNIYTVTSYLIIHSLLLLPLSTVVLCMGCKRWRKRRSVAGAAVSSHSDIFTFHMVALELINILGYCCFCYGVYAYHPAAMAVGHCTTSAIPPGEMLFHLLTCVERYMAVIHPVTYMKLKQSGGVRIRNVSTVCVWLLSFGSGGVSLIGINVYLIFTLLLFVVSTAAVFLCSFSVLCVLIRPGPGEGGRNREPADQTKRRAFYTIVIITGALFLQFMSSLVSYVIYFSQFSESEKCLSSVAALWLGQPSSLVLPLLFLHRAGKLPGCKHNTESG